MSIYTRVTVAGGLLRCHDVSLPARCDPPMSIAVNRARRLASQVGRTFPGTDLALWAAGATFFGVIGLVPLAMAS